MSTQRSFQTEVTINASREKVWDALFTKFGEVHLYNPNIDGSHYIKGEGGSVGCERQCNLDSKTKILERITSAETNKRMSVDIYDGNMPMLDRMLVDFELRELLPNRTVIVFTARFTTKPSFMGVMMKPVMKSKLTDVLIGLKYFLETGKPVSKNTYKPIKKSYKQLAPSQSFA